MLRSLTRRTLLALAPATFGSTVATSVLPGTARAARASRTVPIYDFVVAGCAYHELDRCADLKRGEVLVLRREPDNRHDRNAIEVVRANGRKLGYVPRRGALTLAPMMDGGVVLDARVEGWVVEGGVARDLSNVVHTGAAPRDPVIGLSMVA